MTAAELHAQKKIPVEGLLPAIAHRWSPRAYADRPVAASDLRLVLEAARWSASSSNSQPWRFLVGVRKDAPSLAARQPASQATYDQIAATLVPFNQAWAPLAPVLILAYAAAQTPHRRANPYALFDLGQAVAQMAVQATSLGLATHPMGGFDRDAAQRLIGAPEEFLPGVVLTLGHPGDPALLTDVEMQARELDPRARKPLSEIAFHQPGEPFPF